MQDSKNVDQNCILQNNGNFIGCNGDFKSYQFTENRSVAACNGIMGGYDRSDCFYYGSGYYYSARVWDVDTVYFTDEQGSNYKNDWHHVEAYFRMNSISGGRGITDGKIRYWYDSQLLISYDNILMRTAQFPDLKFNQFLIAPYIGDGSPVEQIMWIDELTVATSPPPSAIINDNSIHFSISPNPATDYIEISFPPSNKRGLGGVSEIRIYNMLGECVLNPTPTLPKGEGVRIDVSGLAVGVYFVRTGKENSKLIIF